MKAEPIEIYLPCDVLTVKVRVGPQEHLSSLEELFIRAIYAGASNFHELVHLFGIGHRPTLDLVFDLWHRGYLVLDLAGGAVHLASQVSRLLADDRLGELAGGEGADELREVLLDKLSGHVLPVSGRRGFPPSRQVAPAEHFDVGIQNITPSALLGALRRVIDAEESSGRTKRVLAAHLSLSHLTQTSDQRWLPLYVACTSDEETGALAIRLVDGGNLPATARTRVVERLAQLVEDQPESAFAKYLHQEAVRGVPSIPEIDDVLKRLEAKIDGLAEMDSGLQHQRHEQLGEIADDFEEWLAERRGAEVETTTIVGHASHSEIIASLVRDADRQVVIACPWLAYDAVHPLLEPLGQALHRGVQVFLLWGIRSDDELDQRVSNALVQLREEYPALFFVSRRSTRTHAKLVIQDDRRALATSLNFLSPSRSETFEVGVLISARDDQTRCPPVERLLDWARGAYPEFTAAQSLYLTREDFARGYVDETGLDLCPPRPVCPLVDGHSELSGEKGLAEAAAALWQLAWTDYHAAARVLSQPQTTAARMLVDGQHRNILWRALRTAQRRLLIASDQLGPEVVDGRFLRRLEERLDAGVFVTLMYRRLLQHAGVAGADPVAQLADLRDRFPDQLECVSEAPSHAKLLVFDDVAVVSSFNFLSFEGYYEERRPAIRRKQRSEVGLMLTGRVAAEQVIEAVRGAFGDALLHGWEAGPVGEASAPSFGATAALHPLASPQDEQTLLARLAEASDVGVRADVVRQAVATVDDPWSLLDRLSQALVPDEVLRLGVAAVLSARWRESESEIAKPWLHWLAKDAWGRRRFTETAVLCGAFPSLRSSEVPGESIALLAAARAVGTPDATLSMLSDRGDLPDNERLVVAGVALGELMLRGALEAWTALENHSVALPPAWKQFAQEVGAYWNQTYQALPIESIRAEVGATQHREAVNAAWAELDQRLGEGASAHFKFESGTRMHEYLYHANAPLGRLRALVGPRDGTGVATWLRKTEHLQDLDEFLDDATRTATERDDQLLERGRRGGKRRSYRKTLAAIVAAAQRVAGLSPPGGTDEESRRMEMARPVARSLVGSWSDLEAEVAARGLADRVVLEDVLLDLRIIADWGAE